MICQSVMVCVVMRHETGMGQAPALRLVVTMLVLVTGIAPEQMAMEMLIAVLVPVQV